ncbi:MAG TPA: glycosyltransferase family 39 protein [Methylomirabilota bacterium]
MAVVVAALYFGGLGAAPFLDPPEGFQAAIARSLSLHGDWITPRVNGIPYFDRPPFLYWLMSASFSVLGVSTAAARLPSAAAAVAIAAVTARLGVVLGGPRLGLLAGLMVAANLGFFVYGRLVKPDMLFILFILLAFAGFSIAYRGGGRRGLVLFYAALGLAVMTKDMLGAIGPLAVVGVFFWLTRERPLASWVPWWGVLIVALIALPWYLVVEARNRGFLWYLIVDNHLLNLTRHRVFPDEDVPSLNPLEFLLVTTGAFLPWALAVPAAVVRAFRGARDGVTGRLWLLHALWAVLLIGLFTVAPFKLPHHGLPAFPALALLTARVWDETIEAAPGSLRPRLLLVPALVLFAVVAVTFGVLWAGVLPLPGEAFVSLDVATRNLVAQGQPVPRVPIDAYRPTLLTGGIIFAVAALGMAWAAVRRAPAFGAAIAIAAMIAFLPVAANGVTQFARVRSTRPIAAALAVQWRPGAIIVHEGSLEDSGALLLSVREPVRVVNGLQSSLAVGATVPGARPLFWDSPQLQEAWRGANPVFLVSVVAPERSVVRSLAPASVHLVTDAGGRRLYANVAP